MADVGLAGSVGDKQDVDATTLVAGQRSGEQYRALVREAAHERHVFLHAGLLECARAICPGGTGFAGHGEDAHRSLPASAGPAAAADAARMLPTFSSEK